MWNGRRYTARSTGIDEIFPILCEQILILDRDGTKVTIGVVVQWLGPDHRHGKGHPVDGAALAPRVHLTTAAVAEEARRPPLVQVGDLPTEVHLVVGDHRFVGLLPVTVQHRLAANVTELVRFVVTDH